MDLSETDNLRLNVLLSQKLEAVRIDESRMTVHGLSDRGEAKVTLAPNCRDETYLKRVREFLSTQVLGSPGGYPVYLRRWTRMGQARDDSLQRLLLLGEPEAVVAAVCAQGLTDELARRAWWAMEDATNARHMLSKQAVVEGRMGPLLAAYLVEHLPFESEPEQQIETVRLVLQQGLLARGQIEGLWRKAQRKPAYYVGFLAARPDDLPEDAAAHPLHGEIGGRLDELAGAGNPLAGLLERVLAARGQAFIATVFRVFDKPSNQDVVNLTLDHIAAFFAAARPEGRPDATLEELSAEAANWLEVDAQAAELAALPGPAEDQLRALRLLSGLSYGVVRPVFRDSTAIGSLMRRKLQPVLTPLLQELSRLRAPAGR